MGKLTEDREFIRGPYYRNYGSETIWFQNKNYYTILGESPFPKVFIDDIEKKVYTQKIIDVYTQSDL